MIRALTGEISQSFRDLDAGGGHRGRLTPRSSSPRTARVTSMEEALAMYREAPLGFRHRRRLRCPAAMDHLVAAIVMEGAGEDPTAFNYIGYDAGGEAMAGLLSGEIDRPLDRLLRGRRPCRNRARSESSRDRARARARL